MQLLLWVLLTVYPLSSLAHEGHGSLTSPVLHQLGEPQHFTPLLLIVVGLVALGIKHRIDRHR